LQLHQQVSKTVQDVSSPINVFSGNFSEAFLSQNLNLKASKHSTNPTMAPNLKNITLLSESLLNLKVIQPKEALNQRRQAQQASQQAKTAASENYWEWTSEPVVTTDFFSANHIEANLVKDSDSTPNTVVTLQNAPSSDDYWAEQEQDVTVESQPLHAEVESVSASPVDSNNYWGWSHEATESDDYWSSNEVEQVARNPLVSAAYWKWSHVATESDDYWSEATSVSSSSNYWNWSPSQQSGIDSYWNMPSTTAC
jgi:hypothetical protein